ncbi:MAG: methyltransferase domain-containing protein [Deltaproteobacteria bacterium]|nr:methyltransferase domain-containing protein [Deltaproteobacteria bacterium]
MSNLFFQKADPAHLDFQYLEDLSTAYWYSEVLFASIELKLFMFLDQGAATIESLAEAAGCRKKRLKRLFNVLERLNLIHYRDGKFYNSQSAGIYLVPGKSGYMGDFFLYRSYMKPRWETIVDQVALKSRQAFPVAAQDDNYEKKTFEYVRAMDILAKQKAFEIIELLEEIEWETPLLDIGGGAGAMSRAVIKTRQRGEALLFEIPGVIQAAKRIYPDESSWERIKTIEGDFRNYRFDSGQKFGTILMNNFLHAYDSDDAHDLLLKAVDLLLPDGLLVIHDYFPDRAGRSPHKGVLYDLSMMLNTYNGACHDASMISEWLKKSGISRVAIRDLGTDSSVVIASRKDIGFNLEAGYEEWTYKAVRAGFTKAVILPVEKIVTGEWARKKCRFGCAVYGKNLQCPPYGMKSKETQDLLKSYKCSLLLEGSPPGREFHNRLLLMEKKAFLAGYHKALVFGAGHCPVCSKCPGDGICKYPEKARPSMEGSGIDVYSTAKNAGISLKPVANKNQYVKYIGLLLLE